MGSNKSIRSIIIPFIKKELYGKKFSAVIDITDMCNLRCRHCYHRNSIASDDSVSLAEWERRFATYRDMGIVYAVLAGGEPTLRYDVMQLAEDYFPFISVFTNGQIKLPEEFNRRIYLSLDGMRDLNDAVRGEGTFDRAVDNYHGNKRVIVNCILSKMNYSTPEALEEFIEFVRSMDVLGLDITFFLPQVNNPQDTAILLDDDERRAVGEVLKREVRRADSILFDTEDAIERSVNNTFIPGRCSCREGNYFISMHNTFKYCTSETNDCSRCRVRGHYYVPIWNFCEWWRFKKMMLSWTVAHPARRRMALHSTQPLPETHYTYESV